MIATGSSSQRINVLHWLLMCRSALAADTRPQRVYKKLQTLNCSKPGADFDSSPSVLPTLPHVLNWGRTSFWYPHLSDPQGDRGRILKALLLLLLLLLFYLFEIGFYYVAPANLKLDM